MVAQNQTGVVYYQYKYEESIIMNKLINFMAYYFNHGDPMNYSCNIEAFSREEAIKIFEQQYPNRMLVSLRKI